MTAQRHDSRLDALKGRLFVYGSGQSCSEAWEDAVGIDPAIFYATLTRGLPESSVITVESTHGGQGRLSIRVGNSKTLIEAENDFSRRHQQIRFDEWRVPAGNDRGAGLGTTLFRNHLDLMQPWGLRFIELRAGREDGPYYWSKRGLRIKDSGFARNFNRAARETYEKLRDQISPELQEKIETILDSDTLDMNVRLARLPAEHKGKKLGAALLYATNPVCLLDIEDEEQMQDVRRSLKAVPALGL